MISKDIERTFNDFEEIYENRNKYSIEWAFEDAQNKLDTFREEIINNKLKNKCFFCNRKEKIGKDFESLQSNSRLALKKQRWYSRLFSNMYNILTFLEVSLSVILVVAISKLSHSSEANIHAEVLSFWVTMTFAFMKVFIERNLLKPRLEALGWKIYLKSVNSIKNMTKEFNKIATQDLILPKKDETLEIA